MITSEFHEFDNLRIKLYFSGFFFGFILFVKIFFDEFAPPPLKKTPMLHVYCAKKLNSALWKITMPPRCPKTRRRVFICIVY